MENDEDSKRSSQSADNFDVESPRPFTGDFRFSSTSDRRFAYTRQPSNLSSPHAPPHSPSSSLHQRQPFLSRTTSTIDMPDGFHDSNHIDQKVTIFSVVSVIWKGVRSGNKPMRNLFLLISLNVAYSTTEFFIGLLSGRIGLVSDAFHLTFGCGILTFSLFAMAASRKKADHVYTYGYKRLQVLSAFTNALFLLFMSFSLAVEGLHAFIQDESEHKHYLIVSAVTNLLVNLIGVWFFRNYARVNIVYRNAEDMNYHSVCLHVLADSIRSAGLILASWLLTLGVKNAEVLCLGLVSVTVFMIVMPLFKSTGGLLLQMAPSSVPTSALSKCWRQVSLREDILEICQARFWELVPGHVIGSISLQVKQGEDECQIVRSVQELYHDLGIEDLSVQADHA